MAETAQQQADRQRQERADRRQAERDQRITTGKPAATVTPSGRK
jgi:hypothetical protein